MTAEHEDGHNVTTDAHLLLTDVPQWQRSWTFGELYYRIGPGFVKIIDLARQRASVYSQGLAERSFSILRRRSRLRAAFSLCSKI